MPPSKQLDAAACSLPNSRQRGSSCADIDTSSTHANRHQAAEQRRRTRINERLDMLRQMVPHTERSNTAAFLEELISYINLLKIRSAELEASVQAIETGRTVPVGHIMMIHELQQQQHQALHPLALSHLQDSSLFGGIQRCCMPPHEDTLAWRQQQQQQQLPQQSRPLGLDGSQGWAAALPLQKPYTLADPIGRMGPDAHGLVARNPWENLGLEALIEAQLGRGGLCLQAGAWPPPRSLSPLLLPVQPASTAPSSVDTRVASLNLLAMAACSGGRDPAAVPKSVQGASPSTSSDFSGLPPKKRRLLH